MPYRRLPTTDKARSRAFEAALKKVNTQKGQKPAISKRTFEELHHVKTTFENHLKQYELDVRLQTENLKEYKTAFDKAKMFVSHFIQVLLLASERGEINGGIKYYDGLQDYEGKLPPLNTEEEIMEWGYKMVKGEQERMEKKGSAIYNPSIAMVKFKVEELKDASIFQKNLKKNVQRSYERMQKIRKSTNDFISALWTEIEENIDADTPKHKRQLAQEYGLVYIFRRNEKKKLKPQDLQRDLLFDFG